MNLENYIQSAFYRKGDWESGWGLNREVTRSELHVKKRSLEVTMETGQEGRN